MAKLTIDEVTTEIILNQLTRHLKEQRPVTLYNTFEGVPVSFEADVAMLHPDYIGLIVHPYQAVCIRRERRTFIQSKSLPALVRAHPVSIDYTNHVVLLKDFKVPKSISLDLFNSWVKPDNQIRVEISSEDERELKAPLLGIAALNKNRIRMVLEVPESIPYQRQDNVELAFRLAEGGDLVQLQGVVNSLTKIRNKSKKRLEVEGKAAMGDEISILAYVASREDQIMGTLDKAYQKLRKGKKRQKK